MDNYLGLSTQTVLEHHGIKGMKWGVHKLYDGHKKNLLYYYKQKGMTDDIISDSENKLETIARRAMYAKQIGGNAAAGAAVGLISNEAAMTAARKLDEKKRKEANK